MEASVGRFVHLTSSLRWRCRWHPQHFRSVVAVDSAARSNQDWHSLSSRRCLAANDGPLLMSKRARDFSSLSWVNAISTSPPVLVAQNALIHLNDIVPFPWWVTIVLTTVGIRFLVTFPFLIYQNYISARYSNLQPEIKRLAEELKKETAAAVQIYGWDEKRARFAFKISLRKHVQHLIERDNCHPFKASLVLWIQIPIWVSISFAFRNMTSMMPLQDIVAQLTYLSLTSGGLLWIPNLTIPDTSLIFPVLLGAINLVIVEIHSLKTLKSTRFQKVVTNLFRAMSIFMVPIAASVPSCLVLYWFTSSLIGLVHNLILMSPGFRNCMKIPQVAGETKTPYRDLHTNFRKKFLWKSD